VTQFDLASSKDLDKSINVSLSGTCPFIHKSKQRRFVSYHCGVTIVINHFTSSHSERCHHTALSSIQGFSLPYRPSTDVGIHCCGRHDWDKCVGILGRKGLAEK
jgi:hypothetical protein